MAAIEEPLELTTFLTSCSRNYFGTAENLVSVARRIDAHQLKPGSDHQEHVDAGKPAAAFNARRDREIATNDMVPWRLTPNSPPLQYCAGQPWNRSGLSACKGGYYFIGLYQVSQADERQAAELFLCRTPGTSQYLLGGRSRTDNASR
ncbi:MAG TPA: hypothetical protein VFE47_03920 [Tepidisphaeraceae bacterium]|jgi:hypothetical protein|nr:hypothetical protein [Tepidisphaeraceae bacterium]